MGRPRLADNDVATAERLLEAAQAEFGRVGFDGARLEDIARAAGISRPSLLYHFGSKDDLYAAAVNDGFGRLGEALSGAIEMGGDFRTRFEELVRRYLAFIDGSPGLVRLILRELLDGRGPGHQMLLTAGLPILDRIERFVRVEGRTHVRRGLPVRAAILELVAGAVIRSASGPLREPLWGKTDRTLDLVHTLFFDSQP
ncbi:MAG: TetR/AcrR family transcriptional regulator [Deltaproteobacteria bacterium]|nr:TetR/AcrR family transcriptional regulator [Deltaproteobacteria bacterium]